MERKCTKCKQVKTVTDFSVRTDSSGFRSHCRKCINEHGKRYRIKVSVSRIAQRKARTACETGNIIKPELCEECKANKPLDKHHDDYNKPLEIRWLCRQCHQKIHVLLQNGAAVAE